MGWNNPDPYNNPDKFGLTPVAMVDWLGDDACYEFSMTQVWFDQEEKKFYWADDSGCSCNAPFEYFEEGDLRSGGFFTLVEELTSQLGETPRPEVAQDVADCIAAALKVRNENR